MDMFMDMLIPRKNGRVLTPPVLGAADLPTHKLRQKSIDMG